MTTYPIKSTSISFNDIRQDLINFVQSKPDANRWRDFYAGGEGTILIELIAGYGFYNALKVIFSCEETYLRYANTLLSARAIAQNSAYSAYRGINRRYTAKFTPNVTVSIPAFTVIGYQGDYDFICLEDVVLNEGVETTIHGTVGTFNSVSLTIPSPDLHVFRFSEDLISEDFKLYLNDQELPTTSVNAEALENKYLVQSNAVGGVDVTYLNLNENATYKYRTGDVLRLDYIQYQNIPYSPEISIDYTDEVTVLSTENTVVPETIESIQAKAPVMYETQLLIRSREDYVKNFLLMQAKFADTTGRDLSAAYLELSYVQKDQSLMFKSDEDDAFRQLTYKRMFGIPLPYINKPRFMSINLDVALKLSSSGISLTEYNELIAKTFSQFEKKFSDDIEEVTLDLAEMEGLLTGQSNIKRAYISIAPTPFVQEGFYQVGDIIYEKGASELYRVTNITYTTSAAEPEWNYTIGSETDDGNIVWQAIPKSGYPIPWSSKEEVTLYDLRVPTIPEVDGIMFRAIRGKSMSSATKEPEWNTEIGSITYDNELIWLAVEYLATAPKWDTNTWFNLGDVVNAGGNSYQVIGERRQASNFEPDMSEKPDVILYEGMLLTKESISDEKIYLPWGVYCIINPKISASVQ